MSSVAGSDQFDGLKNLFNAGIKAASEHYKALAAINDVNLLLIAPVILRDKVIVIDDIERKHEKLGIDEVLGFIDEYAKIHGSRFVLILNDDNLSTLNEQKSLWSTFREKVIDQEIKLLTSTYEAFSIAIGLKPSKYADSIQRASTICSLTNIRIISKIIRVVNQVLGDLDLDIAVQDRVIPSIVLFSAIHYRGLTDGPDFKFALNIGNLDWSKHFRDDNESLTPREEQERRWELLMQELGIRGCDEFEKHLVEFLESGLLDTPTINAVLVRYIEESEAMKARSDAQRYLKRLLWDHRISETQLIEEATNFPKTAHLLDGPTATELHSGIERLEGGVPIAESILERWISGFRLREVLDDDNPFNNTVHPRIQEEYKTVESKRLANTTLEDACVYIYENNGWGTMQEVTLGNATAANFEYAIRNIDDLDKLRKFMHLMLKMRAQRTGYDAHFGSATERFIEACRAICKDPESPRLSSLIKRLLESTGLSSELEEQPSVSK